MKLIKVENVDATLRQHYQVDEIFPEDIAPPPKRFLDVISNLHGFSFINSSTSEEFTAQVQKRFASSKH